MNKIIELNKAIVKSLNKIQKNFYFNKTKRKQLNYWFHHKKIKTVINSSGEKLNLEIYFYYDKVNKKLVKFLPEQIKDYKYLYTTKRHFTNELINLLLKCNKESAKTIIEHFKIKMNVKNLNYYLNLVNLQSLKDEISEVGDVETIQIDIDDFYKYTYNSKNNKIKLTLVKINLLDKHNKALRSQTFIVCDKNINYILKMLSKLYKTWISNKNCKVVVYSDGASSFRNLAKRLNAIWVYDAFHYSKNLFQLVGYRTKWKNSLNYKIFHNTKYSNIFYKLKEYVKLNDNTSIINLLTEIASDDSIDLNKRNEIIKFIKINRNVKYFYYQNRTGQSEANIAVIKRKLTTQTNRISIDEIKMRIFNWNNQGKANISFVQ